MENEWKLVAENSEKENYYEICNFALGETTGLIQVLREQIDDEYEEGTIIQVFGGALGAVEGRVFVAKDDEKIAGIGAVSIKDEE